MVLTSPSIMYKTDAKQKTWRQHVQNEKKCIHHKAQYVSFHHGSLRALKKEFQRMKAPILRFTLFKHFFLENHKSDKTPMKVQTRNTIFLTFMEPCIARCIYYITNEMQLIQCSLLLSASSFIHNNSCTFSYNYVSVF